MQPSRRLGGSRINVHPNGRKEKWLPTWRNLGRCDASPSRRARRGSRCGASHACGRWTAEASGRLRALSCGSSRESRSLDVRLSPTRGPSRIEIFDGRTRMSAARRSRVVRPIMPMRVSSPASCELHSHDPDVGASLRANANIAIDDSTFKAVPAFLVLAPLGQSWAFVHVPRSFSATRIRFAVKNCAARRERADST
jgi:hypothetical protein